LIELLETRECQSGTRLSPAEARLLLLAACPAWSEAQRALAADLVPQVAQWPVFIDTARRKFALPMAYQNLATLADTPLPEEVLATLRTLSLQATAEVLRQHAAFDWFHRNCVLPSGVSHAYFKGPALAAQFYPDPMQRFFRDVDILVPARARIALVDRMLELGCKVLHNGVSGREFLSFRDATDLGDYLRVTDVPNLLTPQGLSVELHVQVDNHTLLFDTAALLNGAREVGLHQNRIRVLAETDHVVYLCYHHTRHLWSKLNWVADLAAVVTHPSTDLAAIQARARAARLDNTVAAALELHELAATARHFSTTVENTPGRDLLRACVDGLHGDLALEAEMRQSQRMGTIGFAWQEQAVPMWRRPWLAFSRRMRPTYDDTVEIRGPRSIRYLWGISRRVQRYVHRLTAGR
jgi:hypothetical protein